MAKLSIEQALTKAKSHTKKGEVAEAQVLYGSILKSFPNNKKAQRGLSTLGGGQQSAVERVPLRAIIDQLTNLYNQGKLEVVVEQAQKLTAQYTESAALWNLTGASAIQIGQLDLAIVAFQQVLAIKPNTPEAYSNMGVALKDQGKLDEAIESCNKAISIKPDNPDAYNNIGLALTEQGKVEEAMAAYNKALAIQPDYAKAYNNMGNALKRQGKLDEAIKAYSKALAIKPDYAEAYFNIGFVFEEQGKLEEAIAAYNKALATKPDYAEAYSNMGVALKDQGKLEVAIAAYNKALGIKPDYAEAYSNMGIALKDQGKLEEAIAAYNKALAIKPDYAEAYSNMGVALKDQGKLEEAIAAYNKALAIKPDYAEAHLNLSFELLSSDRLKEGLEEYEWRWKTTKNVETKRQFSKPLWDGKKNLKGKKILLWCEQGVGDTVNWSSRLPLILSLTDYCTLECQEKLVPLLTQSFPNVEIKAQDRRHDSLRDDFDFHMPMGSLYKHFIPEISQNTKPDAFLTPDPVRIKFWRKRLESLGNGPFIGVSWKSSNISPQRLPNYAPLSEWSPIFTIPGVTLVSLQYTDFHDDLTEIKNKFGVSVHNFDDLDHYNNLADVAALCAALDLVVSTTSTVPLISAGVGTVTKLASWRQSSWNNILFNPVGPSVNIFEKDLWEPWSNVFNAIAKDIHLMTEDKNS